MFDTKVCGLDFRCAKGRSLENDPPDTHTEGRRSASHGPSVQFRRGFVTALQYQIGMTTTCPVNAIRVAYTGELGWELHHPMEMQNYLFDLLEKAGMEDDPRRLRVCGE